MVDTPPQKLEWLGPWRETLIMCPSQLERECLLPGGIKVTVYCRWRHGDPWNNVDLIIPWSGDKDRETLWLELGDTPDFVCDQHKEIEAWAEAYVEEHASYLGAYIAMEAPWQYTRWLSIKEGRDSK